jgi:hypothetical protein
LKRKIVPEPPARAGRVPPPAKVLQTFDKLPQLVCDRIAELVQESRFLTALRDSLLPNLLSEEIGDNG